MSFKDLCQWFHGPGRPKSCACAAAAVGMVQKWAVVMVAQLYTVTIDHQIVHVGRLDYVCKSVHAVKINTQYSEKEKLSSG